MSFKRQDEKHRICRKCSTSYPLDEILVYADFLSGYYYICSKCQEKRDEEILNIFDKRTELLSCLEQKRQEIKKIKQEINHLKWELKHRKGHFDWNDNEKEYHHRLFYKKYGKSWY